jgi:hypothetical protein
MSKNHTQAETAQIAVQEDGLLLFAEITWTGKNCLEGISDELNLSWYRKTRLDKIEGDAGRRATYYAFPPKKVKIVVTVTWTYPVRDAQIVLRSFSIADVKAMRNWSEEVLQLMEELEKARGIR